MPVSMPREFCISGKANFRRFLGFGTVETSISLIRDKMTRVTLAGSKRPVPLADETWFLSIPL